MDEKNVADVITTERLIEFLTTDKDVYGRTWEKVISMVRDPNDLTKAIGFAINEGSKD